MTGVPEGTPAADFDFRASGAPGVGARFRLELPRAASVEIDVIDVSGRRVASVFAGSHGPGVHELGWGGETESGKAAASGVYLARAVVRAEGEASSGSVKFHLVR